MAPEQLAGREVTQRSDLYALGLVLYELFTGKSVFRGKTPAEIARQQQETLPDSPSTVVGEVDDAVERVILRCLEFDPEQRPTSALAVAAALPGGDPVAAALAAGETPSPEMVAARGGVSGIRFPVATAWFVAALLYVALSAALNPRHSLLHYVPLERSTGELTQVAREVVTAAGYDIATPNRYSGFRANSALFDHLRRQGDDPGRWDRLGTNRPPGALFWYRQAPKKLTPDDMHAWSVTPDGPPQSEQGDVLVELDPEGLLVDLRAVAPDDDPGDANTATFDWNVALTLAGYAAEDLDEIAPVRVPTVAYGELKAWRPRAGDAEANPIVQAGALGGRLTYFELLEPWQLDAAQAAEPTRNRVAGVGPGLLISVTLIAGAFLARRNLKMGRSDRRGAFRVVIFIVSTIFLAWILVDVHLRNLDIGALFENMVFGRLLGHALAHSLITWLMYIALEPYVRRLWQQTLVSWTRLLMGRRSDPLVGRDILAGATILGLPQLVFTTFDIGAPSVGFLGGTGALGMRATLAGFLIDLQGAIYVPMAMVVMLLLFRVVLRRNALAVGGMVVVLGALVALSAPSLSANPVLNVVLAVATPLLFLSLALVCLLRFGLLALALYVGLLTYAYVIALGGKPTLAVRLLDT